jgi:hypothetical protein
MSSSGRASLLGFVAPLVGLAVGSGLAVTSPHRSAPLWWIWAPLMVALAVAAGGAVTYGVRRWNELRGLYPVKVADVWAPVAVIGVGGVLGMSSTAVIHVGTPNDYRSGLLVRLVMLAGAPTIGATMLGIRRAALDGPTKPGPGEQLAFLVALQRLLQRLLALAGLLVALVTLETGAFMSLQRSVQQPPAQPPEYILVFGGYGTLVVAAAYVPGWSAIQRRGRELCDALFPMTGVDQTPELIKTANERQQLERIIGTDRTLMADLQNGIAILAPLIAGTVAILLPH